MMRLTDDRLLAERVTLSHIPAPDEPAQDMRFRPSPAFAARVPTLDQMPDPLTAGWDAHLHTAQDTTEMPAVARAETRQDRRSGAYWWLVASVPVGVLAGLVLGLIYGGAA